MIIKFVVNLLAFIFFILFVLGFLQLLYSFFKENKSNNEVYDSLFPDKNKKKDTNN